MTEKDLASWKTAREKNMDGFAGNWNVDNRDHVVGVFDEHNAWADYDEFLFKDIDTKDKIALDFACGPGRNMAKFQNRFKRIDGTDIAKVNLENAKIWMAHNGIDDFNLYKASGSDLKEIEDNVYDNVFSTIAFQHIPVYEIRLNYLKEFFRVLKSGGYVSIQQGFGGGHYPHEDVGYYENAYDKFCDVTVRSPKELEGDLSEIGFTNFKYWIRPTGPGDHHLNWIFWQAQKP